MALELEIRLGAIGVGKLLVDRHDRSEFRLYPSYKEMSPRPVLGQVFEDDPDRLHTSLLQVPPFFSNLLPEGALREIIARQIGVKDIRESYLLAYLGEDLAGAVRAVSMSELDREEAELPDAAQEQAQALRFSLAGVQLKLSMLQEGDRFTLPARDQQGQWIVKLPDSRFARVPENEYSMLCWASAAGIEVPESRLVEAPSLGGLPEGLSMREPLALAVRRFDRLSGGARVHQEDFAQIFDVYPRRKYEGANYATMGAVILRTAGGDDFEAFLDRLVFVVLSGNADAHLKNWSLRYQDGISARLSPAYDLVATILYPDVDASMALNLSGSKRFEDVTWKSFDRLAERLRVVADAAGYDVAGIRARVEAALEHIQDAWATVRADLPLDHEAKRSIESHWRRIPLLSGSLSSPPGPTGSPQLKLF
jgi:serine/threonine-protein kinase HipA